jgi:two-component sensor histidine kinase
MIVTVVVGNVRAGLPDTCPLNDGRFDNESQRPRERRNALVLTSKGFGSPLTGAHHGLGRDICRFFRLTCPRTTDFAFAYDSGEVADVEGVGHGRRHAATAPAGHRRGQEGHIADPTVLGMLRESQNRIKSMSLIHQTLYVSKDFARVDFASFLDSLLPSLVSSYGVSGDRVALSISVDQVQLPINAAIPCGLMVNELISNALKHAFPNDMRGEIKIELALDGAGQVILVVTDNGVGINEALDLSQTTTLGLQLVYLLGEQLGGTLDIHRANPTRFHLRFPIGGIAT